MVKIKIKKRGVVPRFAACLKMGGSVVAALHGKEVRPDEVHAPDSLLTDFMAIGVDLEGRHLAASQKHDIRRNGAHVVRVVAETPLIFLQGFLRLPAVPVRDIFGAACKRFQELDPFGALELRM